MARNLEIKTPLEFRSILPRGGDQRAAFEEMCCLLFAHEYAPDGIPMRRYGAGGDAGLESVIADAQGCVALGIQAKFFVEKLDSTQWRDLDQSVQTALRTNAGDRTLREIVISLPRNLTPKQEKRWFELVAVWQRKAIAFGYLHIVKFTLWHDTHLRGLLLRPEHRGLMLYFFEYPDLNVVRCRARTVAAISMLGDRYLPDLHTATGAEGMLHTFLRSERSRQEFLKIAREKLHDRWWWTITWKEDWPASLHAAKVAAEEEWSKVLSCLGDGITLPVSYREAATLCKKAAASLETVEQILASLIPARISGERPTTSRHPMEEALERTDRWASALRALANYLFRNDVADSACLLFTGDPGSGKTHVLAETCTRYGEQGGIAIFLEGAIFTASEPPWLQILRQCDHDGDNFHDFLLAISVAAEATGLPAVLCIDGLNETPHRDLWRIGIEMLAAEIRSVPRVKLIVSCRSDYLEQTLPEALAHQKATGWAFAEHKGLGVALHKAFPRYIAAYRVQWNGLPPLTREFGNPLFLRTFCESFSGQTPQSGILSLGKILQQYAKRKALLISRRIDYDSTQILNTLRDLADAMQESKSLQLPERKAREICERYHNPNRASRSLYHALLSEGILAELPGTPDELGEIQLVRFTYERVWDYFVSLRLLPEGTAPKENLVAQLRDSTLRKNNIGVVNLLLLRFAEAGHGELVDAIAGKKSLPNDLWKAFLDTISWRTRSSVSQRTRELLAEACKRKFIENEFDFFVPFAPNPHHPWNAKWLHEQLVSMKLSERDRTWTFWVNREFIYLEEGSCLWELISWAEHAELGLLGDDYLELLAIVLTWCTSATVPEARSRLAAILSRLFSERTEIAVRLVKRFLPVDDAYVLERVLLAAASAAQHAGDGDSGLAELALVVYNSFFSKKNVAPHIAARHYAREICEQATKKNVWPAQISVSTFRPPFTSQWPRVWSAMRYENKKASLQNRLKIFWSVEPGPSPPYGNWGRYVMSSAVHHFQSRRLSETPSADRSDRFDVKVAARYVIQRVFDLGWNPNKTDTFPQVDFVGGGQKPIERLSKKYQWIALAELLGYLSDHYHFHDFNGISIPFQSAKLLSGLALPDPYVKKHSSDKHLEESWDFVAPPVPWWKGKLNLCPRPLPTATQCALTEEIANFDPRRLLVLDDGSFSWMALSAFFRWAEPLPVWHGNRGEPHVASRWSVQSYLVPEEHVENLLLQLSKKGLGPFSLRWLDEPEFGHSLAAMRDFPSGFGRLRTMCELDHVEDTSQWQSGAFSTTCRYSGDGEPNRARAGSMPSPQLADLGNLKWLRIAFDFSSKGSNSVVVRHVGEELEGVCIVRRQNLIDWLINSKLRLVWRVYGFKYRLHEKVECHGRSYWMTYILEKDGTIKLHKGATGLLRGDNGPGPDEELPLEWCAPS